MSDSPSTGPALAAVTLTGTETVQKRPLLLWEGETGLPDCVSSTKWPLTTETSRIPPLTLMMVGIIAHHSGCQTLW